MQDNPEAIERSAGRVQGTGVLAHNLYLRRDGGVVPPRRTYFAPPPYDLRVLVPFPTPPTQRQRYYRGWQPRLGWGSIRRWPTSDWRVTRFLWPREYARQIINDLYLRLSRKIELEALRVLLLHIRFGTVQVEEEQDWSIAPSTADSRLRSFQVLQNWVHLVLRAWLCKQARIWSVSETIQRRIFARWVQRGRAPRGIQVLRNIFEFNRIRESEGNPPERVLRILEDSCQLEPQAWRTSPQERIAVHARTERFLAVTCPDQYGVPRAIRNASSSSSSGIADVD